MFVKAIMILALVLDTGYWAHPHTPPPPPKPQPQFYLNPGEYVEHVSITKKYGIFFITYSPSHKTRVFGPYGFEVLPEALDMTSFSKNGCYLAQVRGVNDPKLPGVWLQYKYP